MSALRETFQGWCQQIFGSSLFSDVETVLRINPSSGAYSGVWSTISNIYQNVCVPIGMGLVLIYFMVNLLEKSTQQQGFDLEHMIKLLLKLFVGLYFIQHGLELMASIYSLGFAFLTDIANVSSADFASNSFARDAWTSLTGESWNGDWGFFESIGKIFSVGIPLLIPWLVTLVMKVIVNFVCYSRLIEFYIRTAAAPIALSDFFTEGVHGNGWRFVKGYIAVALQAGVIMLSIVIFNAIAAGLFPESMTVEYWGFLLKYLAVAFATIGVMLKSLSLTKELIGAN